MNYEALQWLVKSIISTFKCGDCSTWVKQKDLNIKAIEWNSIVINVSCPNCEKVSSIKSEIMSVDLAKLNLSKEQLALLRKWVAQNNVWKIWKLKPSINDNLIIELNKDLKKENLNVSDLF